MYISADELKGRISTCKKAPGADDWKGDAMSLLPLNFYEQLAKLWNRTLQCGKVPKQWKQIRTLMIPKADGGQRPLSIAPLVWRAGMSCILTQVDEWVQQWVPNEVVGGVKGRSAETIHDDLFRDIN